MSLHDPKAVVHFAGNDLFIGITPSNHAVTLDTDHTRGAAPSPMELLLIALGAALQSMLSASCERNVRTLKSTASKWMASGARTSREAFRG